MSDIKIKFEGMKGSGKSYLMGKIFDLLLDEVQVHNVFYNSLDHEITLINDYKV